MGKPWRDTFLDNLPRGQRKKTTREKRETVFRIGGNQKYKSTEKITFPCGLAEKTVLITADVVGTDIPLLLSKPFMKSFGGIMNLQSDTFEFFEVTLPMATTSLVTIVFL